jgi:hypothetical protein
MVGKSMNSLFVFYVYGFHCLLKKKKEKGERETILKRDNEIYLEDVIFAKPA